MTASLAVQLLDLDESTGIWPDEVRVRHLLAHVTGYGGEIGDLARFGEGDDALGAAVAELPSVERLVPLDAAWSYANTGYWLAGWLAARQNGSTYEEALAGARARPGRARGGDVRVAEPRRHRPRRQAAATIRARAALRAGSSRPQREVGRFADWQLRQPWTNALRVPLAKPPGGVYGLGFFGERVAEIDIWGHPGSYGGFQSSLLLVPSRDAWLVGLTNSSLGSQALRDVEDAWFEELLGARRRVAPTVELEPAALARLGRHLRERGPDRDGDARRRGLLLQTDDLEATARPIGPSDVRDRRRRCRSQPLRLPARRFRPHRQPARPPRRVIAAVAAGHPATAEAGVEILAAAAMPPTPPSRRHSRRVSRRP